MIPTFKLSSGKFATCGLNRFYNPNCLCAPSYLVLSKFLDVEHLISLCIQIPKKEDVKTSEARITEIIYLKHTLELVQSLADAIKEGENPLFVTYAKVRRIVIIR